MKSRGMLAFLLFACVASAQIDPGSVIPRVRVQVALANQGCDAATQVTLMSSAGPFAEAKANEQCEADFFRVPSGSYHLIVSSPAGAYTESGLIEMNSPGSEELEVKVKRSNDLDLGRTMPASAFVSASDLGIPGRARKQVRKANELLAKQDLTHALENLQKSDCHVSRIRRRVQQSRGCLCPSRRTRSWARSSAKSNRPQRALCSALRKSGKDEPSGRRFS